MIFFNSKGLILTFTLTGIEFVKTGTIWLARLEVIKSKSSIEPISRKEPITFALGYKITSTFTLK